MSENILKIKDISLSYEESCVVSGLNLDVRIHTAESLWCL